MTRVMARAIRTNDRPSKRTMSCAAYQSAGTASRARLGNIQYQQDHHITPFHAASPPPSSPGANHEHNLRLPLVDYPALLSPRSIVVVRYARSPAAFKLSQGLQRAESVGFGESGSRPFSRRRPGCGCRMIAETSGSGRCSPSIVCSTPSNHYSLFQAETTSSA